MEAEHSPGPWHESFVSSKTWNKGVYDQSGAEIALVKVKSALSSRRRDADARLIAAAPELLEALRRCVGALRTVSPGGDGDPDVEFARAAIEKATGT